MSNLSSKFYVHAGLEPHDRSALRKDIQPKGTNEYAEGAIVAVENEAGTEVIDNLSSTAKTTEPPDVAWLVIQGNDQSDGATADKCTCLLVQSGVVWQVETSESFTIGDLCRADAGVLKPLTGANEKAVGLIIGVNSSDGTVLVASAS
jgi:hypothetical protein